MLIDGTAEGISQHVKAQFERGRLMVEKVRDIIYDLGENPDEFCPIAEGDKPWLVRLEALMHDTCNTAEAAAQSIIDEKGQKGIEFFGEEAWAALPVEARATLTWTAATTLASSPVSSTAVCRSRSSSPCSTTFRAR